MSEGLPFLPGYRIETKPKSRYHKAHMFDVQNGIRVDNTRDGTTDFSGTNILGEDPLLVTSGPAALSSTNPYSATYTDFEATKTSGLDASKQLPSWVAYDRKVLRFYCYFKEAVFSSPTENFRVRKCVLYYYLEDDSIHIAEPKIENSGINQGVILKRHRVPKSNGQYTSVADLGLGQDITIYGRIYHMTDCDAFTRAFFESNGRPLGESEDTPLDPFTKRHTIRATTHNKLMHPHKEFMEASLGKSMYGTDVEGTQKFLINDGKVLRFYATWSDPNLFGEKQAYIVHYFLADDTVEVLEVQQPNSGRDPFPALLKRGKLPKNYSGNASDLSRIGVKETHSRFYTEADFRVGDYIMVYGRRLFLCGADRFTQEFYCINFGMTPSDFPRLNMDDDDEVVPRMLPPPHTGFGSEEDSLGSFLYLMQKVPKQDFKKLMENDGLTMRFMAKFVNPLPEDRDRKFIVTFYLADDTIAIFEKFERNSGFVGGKFLERSRVKNQQTGEYFKPIDFYAGGRVCVNSFVLDLIEADECTLKWMTQNVQYFGEDLLDHQKQYMMQQRSMSQRM